MRRALVALNTELPPLELWRPWLDKADLVVGADGGADRLLALGIEADAIVGDLDSVLGSTRRRLGPAKFHRRTADTTTDLEKSLEYVHAAGCHDVTIVTGHRARLDHTLGHVAVLLEQAGHLGIRMVDHDFVTEPVLRRATFRAPIGTLVSLFAPREARGITTRGLRWPLKDARLRRGTLGIHNQVAANPVEVTVREGLLLLLRGHRVEPHR